MPIFLAILGIAALVTYATYSGTTSSQQGSSPSAWPPSAALQDTLATEMAAYLQNASGVGVTASQVAPLIASAPQQYVAQLPPGTAPTISGYQTWIWSRYAQGLQGYYASGGYPSASAYG